MSEYSRRYWVSADGVELEAVSGRSANNHVSIAIDYFRSRSEPVPSSDCRVYAAMFGRGFMRVIAEEEMGITDSVHVDNDGRPITPEQSGYLRAMQGRHPNMRVHVNDRAFESTRSGRQNANMPISEVMQAALDGTMPDRERRNAP